MRSIGQAASDLRLCLRLFLSGFHLDILPWGHLSAGGLAADRGTARQNIFVILNQSLKYN